MKKKQIVMTTTINTPVREVYVHEYQGKVQRVCIWIQIDYVLQRISIIDGQTAGDAMRIAQPKQYMFSGRSLDYMCGWQDILDGTKSAIDDAEKKLQAYKELLMQSI